MFSMLINLLLLLLLLSTHAVISTHVVICAHVTISCTQAAEIQKKVDTPERMLTHDHQVPVTYDSCIGDMTHTYDS